MHKQEFDYIVIGGGSAGCVLASRLSEDASATVALLEAGPVDSSVLIHCPAGLAVIAKNGQANWKLQTEPQPGLNGRRGYQPRGKVLGGSSSVNAMVYTRGFHEDYDHWASLGNPGWGWADVLPWFLKAEHNERGADAWHATGGPLNVMDLRSPNGFSAHFVQAACEAGHAHNRDFNAADPEGVGLYQVTHRNGERCSAAKAYVTPHLGRPNLQVLTSVHATRIVFEGRRAVGVELRRRGAVEVLRARREVIVSSGSLHSPQLLMLSGIGPGAELQRLGIAVLHDQPGVGANLHDHPDVVVVADVPQATELFGISPAGIVKAVQGIFEWRSRRSGMLTTNFAEAGGFLRSAPEEPLPDLQLHFVVGKLVDHGRKTVFGHGYSCHVCVLQPRSRGRLALASADPFAAPRIDPNFLGDADDAARLVRGFRLVRRILEQPALAGRGSRESRASAAAQTDAEIERFVRDHADTIYHPVGTCRMGPSETDVVDAELRVRGVQALRVVDASIMPRIVSGNTNAPVIMIAEKASEMIKAAARR